MNKKNIIVLITFSILALAGILSSGFVEADIFSAVQNMPSDSFYCRAVDFPKQDISSAEEKELLYMREEEKLAHDVYYQMYDKYGLRPFYNITFAEERHMSAIKSMINKYNLADPVKNTGIGSFTNSDLEKTYNALIQQGNKSEMDALKAGAEIEELDIKDLMTAIKSTDNDDLKFVYNSLKNASGNHLRAFMRNIERRGGSYTPKHLDKKLFDEILVSKCEN